MNWVLCQLKVGTKRADVHIRTAHAGLRGQAGRLKPVAAARRERIPSAPWAPWREISGERRPGERQQRAHKRRHQQRFCHTSRPVSSWTGWSTRRRRGAIACGVGEPPLHGGWNGSKYGR